MKQLACLLGLHIGDSFGASLEFQAPSPRNNFQEDIVGGGKLRWKPGMPTDDTTMMLMLFESLLSGPHLDIYDLSSRFIDWWMSEPIDIGRTTFYSIQNMVEGKSPGKWGMTGEFDQGNGSLMRCAPMALFDLDQKTIHRQTAMTHNQVSCKVSDEIFIQMLKDAFAGKSKFEIYKNAIKRVPSDLPKLKKYLEEIPQTKWEDLPTSGYVYHTLAASLWGLLHTESFEEAIIEVANRGDDADTCAAVTGALCGAYYGMESLPKNWLAKIQAGPKIKSLFKVWSLNN